MARSVLLQLQPAVLRWARERAGLGRQALARKLGVPVDRIATWERDGRITLARARKLSAKTWTPFGFLFLSAPPEERLPIPDYRTTKDVPPRGPSVHLLEVIEAMRARQEWMRDEAIGLGLDPLPFVGSGAIGSDPRETAARIRDALGLQEDWAADLPTWREALRLLRRRVEEARIVVVVSGVVGWNTHRRLDPDEFRGFALVDEYVPLVFVNGADFVSAQMFTLAHELAHVWIGRPGVSNPWLGRREPEDSDVEKACNRVAAEFLVPERRLVETWPVARGEPDPFAYLAARFKVSTIVAARRALDAGLIPWSRFRGFLDEWAARERSSRSSSGGDFWRTADVRLGGLFARLVARAVREGRLLYRDAWRLTGLRGVTFDAFLARIQP